MLVSGSGRFLQVDGLVFTYNANFPVGQRLIAAQIKDADGGLSDISPSTVYSVCTNSYMAQGGDAYAMIPANAFNVLQFGPAISTTVIDYVKHLSVVNITLDGRIKSTNQTVSSLTHVCVHLVVWVLSTETNVQSLSMVATVSLLCVVCVASHRSAR